MLRDETCKQKSKKGKSCVLEAIHLKNFRNLSDVYVEFGPGVNVLEGRNGQGKTNLLEAVVLLGGLRSFRGGRFQTMVCSEKESFQLEARLRSGDEVHIIQQNWSKKGRRISVDDQLLRKSSELLNIFPVVFFGPDDLEISKGSPGNRRHFLDEALILCDPEKIRCLRDFQEVLKQRNKALKETREGRLDRGVLRVYTQAFAKAAQELERERAAFLDIFSVEFTETFSEITDGGMNATIGFRTQLGEIQDHGLEELDDRDLIMGTTQKGPHRADLKICLNQNDVLGRASQGQHRLIVIALKIALLRKIETQRDCQPLLLLDDVSSELDSGYSQLLSSHLLRRGSQVFATTTDAKIVGLDGAEINYFGVGNGEIEKRKKAEGQMK